MLREYTLNGCPICKKVPVLPKQQLEDGHPVECPECKNTGTVICLLTTGEIYIQWHYETNGGLHAK